MVTFQEGKAHFVFTSLSNIGAGSRPASLGLTGSSWCEHGSPAAWTPLHYTHTTGHGKDCSYSLAHTIQSMEQKNKKARVEPSPKLKPTAGNY